MPVLLNLGGECAASWCIALPRDEVLRFDSHRMGQTVPLHCGVALGGFGVQEFSVFDEQQTVYQLRRQVIEAFKHACRVALLKQSVLATILNGQAPLNFLGVRSEKTRVQQFGHAL